MAMADNRLVFRLEDHRKNVPLTPDTVDLPTLRGFLDDVEKLTKGNEPTASLKGSQVRIEEGSLKLLVLVSAHLAHSLQADLEHLEKTKDLDSIQTNRADIVEKWQARARKNPRRIYQIGREKSQRPMLRIARDTTWQRGNANSWVAVEKYLTGRVIDLGGKSAANVHLLLPGGDTVVVESSEKALSAEKENLIYREMTLRVLAEENLATGEMRNARLIEFVSTSNEVDEDALRRLWQGGEKAWAGVEDPAAWVEGIRGR